MPENLPAIPPEHRITYAEARRITGRSTSYLTKLATEGRLTQVRGRTPRRRCASAWLSRPEVEALALAEDDQGRRTAYWCTVAQAPKPSGVRPNGPQPAAQA